MLKLARRAKGHFMTLIEIRVHLIRCKPGHISNENENYKYLGVLEADDVKHSQMKDRIQKEYFRTVKTILNSIREIR